MHNFSFYHLASLLFSAWLLPPGLQTGLLLGSALLHKRRPRASLALLVLAMLSLYVLSTPYFARPLIQDVETRFTPLPAKAFTAVVCLTGGNNYNAPEFGGTGPSGASALRCLYGLMLAHERHLPLVISGAGYLDPPEALKVQDYLNRLQTPVTLLLESDSRNTQEAPGAVLQHYPHLRGSIILVTDALHMHRASGWFRQAGFEVSEASTRYVSFEPTSLKSFMPDALILDYSRAALREWSGQRLLPHHSSEDDHTQ